MHPTAILEEPVRIGPGTNVWHFSHIVAGAEIGAECVLGQNVFVASTVKIGDRAKIQNNVSLYDGVELESDVSCGPSVVFTNVTHPRSFVSRRHEFKKTLIRRGATIGANATILCGTTIGSYAFVGAGSVVTWDVLDYALAFGTPARQRGWVCRCGIKLKKEHVWVCSACSEEYTIAPNGSMIPAGGSKAQS